MGNCQASDAVAAVVEYPGGRIEKLYWSVTARQLMLQNPGHYVGVYIWAKISSSSSGHVKPKLKLLPPAAILHVGKCYRLVTYEEVIGDVTKKRGIVRIPKDAMKQCNSASKVTPENSTSTSTSTSSSTSRNCKEASNVPGHNSDGGDESKVVARAGQWRPSLQSISEMGS